MRHGIVEGDDYSLNPPFVVHLINRLRKLVGKNDDEPEEDKPADEN